MTCMCGFEPVNWSGKLNLVREIGFSQGKFNLVRERSVNFDLPSFGNPASVGSICSEYMLDLCVHVSVRDYLYY